jgi:hypothetical protein
MGANMRKTPSYLKGLAETRARAASDVARLERLTVEIAEQLLLARQELAACDTLIRSFDSRLDPTQIEPVAAWKGRYGKRGALKHTILEIVKAASPNAISTFEIALGVRTVLKLDFETNASYVKWLHNSVGKPLQRLVADGKVERLHEARPTGEVGRWRWKDCDLSLDHLRAQAATAGVSVQQADDVHE